MDDDFGGNDADFLAALHTAERSASSRPAPAPAPHAQPSTTTNSASSGPKPKVQQPTPQALPHRAPPSSILVSPRQKGNPILTSIRAIPWEYSDIPADYLLSPTTCCLFLSLKYHRLHPEYIYNRIRALGHKYNLRVLLTMVDIPNHEDPLRELSKTSLVNNLTLILCWSAAEAGRYLELFKTFEHANASSIRAHQATGFSEKVVEFITVPRSVNKTDAVGLMSNFGSVKKAIQARPEEIGLIAGWGEKKVERWCGAVREPFRVRTAARRGNVGLLRGETTMGESGDEDRRVEQMETDAADAEKRTEHRVAEDVGRGVDVDLLGNDRDEGEFDIETGPDDEELLAAAEAAQGEEEALVRSGRPDEEGEKKGKRKAGDGLSEGMMAALAKLREQP